MGGNAPPFLGHHYKAVASDFLLQLFLQASSTRSERSTLRADIDQDKSDSGSDESWTPASPTKPPRLPLPNC